MGSALNYLLVHTGTLAGEFCSILNASALFGGLVGCEVSALTETTSGSGLLETTTSESLIES